MTFRPRPDNTTDGRTAIELWDGPRHAATVYAMRDGLHIVCQPGYEPSDLAVEVQEPTGVLLAIRPTS